MQINVRTLLSGSQEVNVPEFAEQDIEVITTDLLKTFL